MRKRTGIRPKRHLDSFSKRTREILASSRNGLGRGKSQVLGVLLVPLSNVDGGHEVRAALLHQLDDFFGDTASVLDGIHACKDGILDADGTVRVGCRLSAHRMSRF